MRLALITNPNSTHSRRWVQYFAERGHEIHLISEVAPREPALSAANGTTFHKLTVPIKLPIVRFLALGFATRRLVRRIQPDLLHAHTVSPGGWLAAMAGYHPLMVTAWGSDLLVAPGRSWIFRRLARWMLRQADYVTCVSEDLTQAARSLGADPDRLEVAPWGVDTDLFYPAPPDGTLRAKLNLAEGPIVLSLRGVRPIYHPLDIAQAIPLVLEQVPAAQFVIRTYNYDPELLQRFQAIVDDSGATGDVHYVGRLAEDREIAALNRLADVGVSVPASDGTPISVLEALACGVALVVSDLPSLREWVQDQRHALFVPVGDVGALSAAIVRLLSDEPLRQKLSEHGSRMVCERADSRIWMRHHEAIYQRLIEGYGR